MVVLTSFVYVAYILKEKMHCNVFQLWLDRSNAKISVLASVVANEKHQYQPRKALSVVLYRYHCPKS